MDSITQFQIITAQIMVKCYDSFPKRIALSAPEIAHITFNSRDTEFVVQIAATFEWLKDAGFLLIGSQDLNHFYEVTLTEKALATVLSFTSEDVMSLARSTVKAEQIEFSNKLIINGAHNG